MDKAKRNPNYWMATIPAVPRIINGVDENKKMLDFCVEKLGGVSRLETKIINGKELSFWVIESRPQEDRRPEEYAAGM